MIIILSASKYVLMLAVACDSDCVNGISERDKSERFWEDDDFLLERKVVLKLWISSSDLRFRCLPPGRPSDKALDVYKTSYVICSIVSLTLHLEADAFSCRTAVHSTMLASRGDGMSGP